MGWLPNIQIYMTELSCALIPFEENIIFGINRKFMFTNFEVLTPQVKNKDVLFDCGGNIFSNKNISR